AHRPRTLLDVLNNPGVAQLAIVCNDSSLLDLFSSGISLSSVVESFKQQRRESGSRSIAERSCLPTQRIGTSGPDGDDAAARPNAGGTTCRKRGAGLWRSAASGRSRRYR